MFIPSRKTFEKMSRGFFSRVTVRPKKYKRFSIAAFCRRGFTLMELMVAIAIIATLSAIAVPKYSSYRDKAIYLKVIMEMKLIEKEVLTFYIFENVYPATLAVVGLGNLRDAWGNPYVYIPSASVPLGKRRSKNGIVPVNTDFDLYSMGKDGESVRAFTANASQDDIVRANNGGYFGLASDY